MTYAGLGVGEAVRVGHNLQEDIHLVQDGGEGRVTAIIIHNLIGGRRCNSQCDRLLSWNCRGRWRKWRIKKKMEAPSWRTRCRWPGWPTPWSGCRCQSRWQDDCLERCFQCWTVGQERRKVVVRYWEINAKEYFLHSSCFLILVVSPWAQPGRVPRSSDRSPTCSQNQDSQPPACPGTDRSKATTTAQHWVILWGLVSHMVQIRCWKGI